MVCVGTVRCVCKNIILFDGTFVSVFENVYDEFGGIVLQDVCVCFEKFAC